MSTPAGRPAADLPVDPLDSPLPVDPLDSPLPVDPLDPAGAERAAVAAARATPYAVWAPHAEAVELVLVDAAAGDLHDTADRWPVTSAHALERGPGGWWLPGADARAAAAALQDGNPGYGFRVDGADPVPDPRSRRQPDTVHGPSRRDLEAADFPWTDADWTGPAGVEKDPAAPQGGGLRGAVLYELHVGTFTPDGTLDSAIERLPHLVDLGVTHVELLPVNSWSGDRNWGYDGVAWNAVDESYGGPEAYRRFVDAAHAAGLGVVQDVVHNHAGPSGNYLNVLGPYLTDHGTGWGDGPNLDGPDSDEVRALILDNVRLWLEEMHVDGLRLDAVHALVDTRAVHLLEEMAVLADGIAARAGRPVPLMVEWDRNDPRVVLSRSAGGLGLAGAWDDDVHHALHVAATGETHGYYADFAPLEAVAKVMERVYFHDGTRSTFRGHDHGRPVPASVPSHAFVVSIQNHDQVGNRAAGDRTAAALTEGALAAAAALLLAGPFTPMLFMGEEFAATTPWPFFTAHREPELAQAVREGRRREFGAHGWAAHEVPDPQDPATRDGAVLDWSALEPAPRGHSGAPSEAEAAAGAAPGGPGRGARILEAYRGLLAARRALPALTDPDRSRTRVTVEPGARHVRMDRLAADGSGDAVLLTALGDEPMSVPDDLKDAVLVAGHGDAGPLGSSGRPWEVPGSVPAPGFLLLHRAPAAQG